MTYSHFQEEPILLIRIPSNTEHARLMLKDEFDEEWNDISQEELRHKVSKKLVTKALEWIGRSDKSNTKQKIYRNMYDKNSPKSDFGIFLTNALPLR